MENRSRSSSIEKKIDGCQKGSRPEGICLSRFEEHKQSETKLKDSRVFGLYRSASWSAEAGGHHVVDFQASEDDIKALQSVGQIIGDMIKCLGEERFLQKGFFCMGPPGTGKTLLARAVASTLNISFLKVVASAIVDKYIGESARIIREMFDMRNICTEAGLLAIRQERDHVVQEDFMEGCAQGR
ncbi:unnamed protein product [Sphagnum compactum]